jgi:hypothetical protein
MTIDEFLKFLPPSGNHSFEGLVGELLEALTGLRFYAARSGDQRGRDGRATGSAGGAIAFECKRYSGENPLKDRDLVGGLTQAHKSLPNLDVWILAASRKITDQNLTELEEIGGGNGIDILPLESFPDCGGNLDILFAAFPQVVARFAKPEEVLALQSAIAQASSSSNADSRLANIRTRLLQPSSGWQAWRAGSHSEWLRIVAEESASRSRLGQPLNVTTSRVVPRTDAELALDEWWRTNSQTIFAVTGEEGDGKSWTVAQWLTKQVGQAGGDFSPIVFIPSRDAEAGKSLEDLILDNLERLFASPEWGTKLRRWRAYPPAGDQALAVIVLDGLNERHDPEYWRRLIEESLDKPWAERIRVICTARTRYWNEHFSKRPSIPVTRHALSSFSDQELELALSQRGLTQSDFPEELRALLRKPRYFDLAAKYRDKVSESGDFTLARLYFEDWRDRCDRSIRPMSEESFNAFLRQVAEHYRESDDGLKNSEIGEFIGLDADTRAAFRELVTGGVLKQQGTRWMVNEERLPLALGLLLGDALQTAAADGRNLKEVIASWLEPHTGSDMEALIVEYALLASYSQNAAPPVIVGLLLAWIDTQNPRSPRGSPIERRLVAYMPNCLDVYVHVAESVWSSKGDHPWAQEVLLRGFVNWAQSSPTVLAGLIPVLERWLTSVPLDGPPMFRRKPDGTPATGLDGPVKALWPDAEPGRDFMLAHYRLRLINDDGWLRLSHAAFVIISSIKDRRPLVNAFTSFCLAKAVHESADGGKEIRWAIRSSEINLEPEFESHINRLRQDSSRPAQMALTRILRYLGTTSAWQTLSEIDEDTLFPSTDLEIDARKNPVESIFRCSKEDLEEYAGRQDFKPWSFIHSAEDVAADPTLNLPADFGLRFDPILESLATQAHWQGTWKSGEDYFLEKAEIVLARVDHRAIGEVIRRIVTQAGTRSPQALYSLSHRLSDYDLLLDHDSRMALQSVRERNPEIRTGGDNQGAHCEFFLFSRVLPLWYGSKQLSHVLARPDDAFDWIDFEWSYQGPVDEALPAANTPRSLFRTLYYLSVVGEAKLDKDMLRAALTSDDSLVRGALFRYLYSCNFAPAEFKPYLSKWCWNAEMHVMEQTFGSLLLMDLMADEGASADWMRVDPNYRATALLKVGASEVAWCEYAAWFAETTLKLNIPLSNEDIPAFEIAAFPQEPGPAARVSLAPDPPRSIHFIAAESHWGGRSSDQPFSALTEDLEVSRERQKAQLEQLRSSVTEASRIGNFWLQRSFPVDAIETVLDRVPEIIGKTIRYVTKLPEQRIPLTAFSYYSALAEVLFSRGQQLDDAVALYRALRQSVSGIRITDPGTGLSHLDVVLFNAPNTDQTRSLWSEVYWGCTTDSALLELVILVRRSERGASAAWLTTVISDGLTSSSPYEFARAAALRGFLESDPEADWLSLQIDDDSPWSQSIVKTAQGRVKAENNARHWFSKFCSSVDLDEAWAAFRLFLKSADRRCWLWCDKELAVLADDDRRRGFFQGNREDIRRECRENEGKLSKTFLGCEIVDAMYPWQGWEFTSLKGMRDEKR